MPLQHNRNPLEREVLNDCLKWLNKTGHIWAWRRTIGKFKVRGRIIQVGLSSQADIEGLVTVHSETSEPIGVHLEVEAKRKGNKPTQGQAAYLMAIQAAGGIGIWADSVEMLVAKLKEEFEERGWEWP